MKYTIPISLESSKNNAATIWDYVNARKVRNARLSIIGAFVILALMLVKGIDSTLDYIFVSFAGFVLLVYIPFWWILKRHRNRYMNKFTESSGFLGSMDIELSDNSFSYTTELLHSKVNWKLITSYILVGDALALLFYDAALVIIDKSDLSEKEFNEILAFVKTKTPLAKKKDLR